MTQFEVESDTLKKLTLVHHFHMAALVERNCRNARFGPETRRANWPPQRQRVRPQ